MVRFVYRNINSPRHDTIGAICTIALEIHGNSGLMFGPFPYIPAVIKG